MAESAQIHVATRYEAEKAFKQAQKDLDFALATTEPARVMVAQGAISVAAIELMVILQRENDELREENIELSNEVTRLRKMIVHRGGE